jgi:hypothetical protein
MTSYVKRELRGLHDVDLAGIDESDYFFISVCPAAIKLSNGIAGGIAISYVFEKGDRIEHAVLVGGPNDLKALCENIVARFDTYWLQPKRRR